jgi:hypothetical protein
MGDVFSAEFAELVSLQPVRIVLLVLGGRIVPLFAGRTSQINNFSHLFTRQASGVKRKAMASALPSFPHPSLRTPHAPYIY